MTYILISIFIVAMYKAYSKLTLLRTTRQEEKIKDFKDGKIKINSLEEGKYEIKKGIAIITISSFSIFVLGSRLLAFYGSLAWGWNPAYYLTEEEIILYEALVIVYSLLLIGSLQWRVVVDGSDIYYRNYFGIYKKFSFLEVDKVVEVKNMTNIVFYNGRIIFSIDKKLKYSPYFLYTAQKHNIKIEKENFLSEAT